MDAITQHNFETRLSQLERNTNPSLSWLIVIPLALATNLIGIPYVQENNIPYVSKALANALEIEREWAIDLGVYVADVAAGEKRRLPRQIDRFAFIGLTQIESNALMQNISDSESSGSYTVRNDWYYVGRWQFGASALAAIGYMNKRKLARQPRCVKNGRCQKGFMLNPKNWNRDLSFTKFRYSKKLQDAAFVKLTNLNIRDGFRNRVLNKRSRPEKIAGFAKAAHLKGLDAAIAWYKYGKDDKDGNKTKVSKYARQAERAITKANRGN